MQAMRDIYEATLAAHIELVGTPDEYSGFANIDPYADSYRKDRLHGEQYSSAYEAWQIVKDKTLQDFRDGNLQVYVPVHENTDLVNRSSRGFSPDATCFGDGGSRQESERCLSSCKQVPASCELGVDLNGNGQHEVVLCEDEGASLASECKFYVPAWQLHGPPPSLGHVCAPDSCMCAKKEFRLPRCDCE